MSAANNTSIQTTRSAISSSLPSWRRRVSAALVALVALPASVGVLAGPATAESFQLAPSKKPLAQSYVPRNTSAIELHQDSNSLSPLYQNSHFSRFMSESKFVEMTFNKPPRITDFYCGTDWFHIYVVDPYDSSSAAPQYPSGNDEMTVELTLWSDGRSSVHILPFVRDAGGFKWKYVLGPGDPAMTDIDRAELRAKDAWGLWSETVTAVPDAEGNCDALRDPA